MAIKYTRVSRIVDFLDRIFTGRKLVGEDQVLVKRGNGGQDAIDGRRRETRSRSSLICCGREHQRETVSLLPTGKHAEIFQEQQSMRWAKLLIGESLFLEKGHEMQQVKAVSREGIWGTPTSAEMPHEARDNGNGTIIVVQELKGNILFVTELDTADVHGSLAPSVGMGRLSFT